LESLFIVALLGRVFDDNCVVSFASFLALAFPSSGTSTS
jgi:hypothetical protein